MISVNTGFPDRSALQTHQVEKLRVLLAAVLTDNSFYTAKLQTAGVDTSISSLKEFSCHVPFTSKQELVEDQQRNPPYGTNLTYSLERYSRFNQTSGTTRQPLRWLDTPESWSWMLDCWTRVFEAAGTDFRDHIFFPFSFSPFLGFWVAFEAATRMNCLTIPGGGMRSSARLQIILDNDVTVICTTPTYAIHLGEIAAKENLDLAAGKVRRIIVAGEPGGSIPATRALIEKYWLGAHVLDHHGMTEMGPVSYECPKRRGVLHVMEAGYFAEVIDPQTLMAVGPGEMGELVLTNLARTGSPLLRYRTQDLVHRAQSEHCECGSYELALEGGILSRLDDMVVVQGVNLYPSAVEEVLRSCGGVGEFRVEISDDPTLAKINLHVEPASAHEDNTALQYRVEAAFKDAFSLRAVVSCVKYNTLPRFETKAQRWVRL